MNDRFFCSSWPQGESAFLEGAEAHHLARVLRKSVGERIELFDGAGRFAAAEILAVSKKSVELKILETWVSPPPRGEIVLATAAPKGDRFRFLVEKAVELGVDHLLPMLTERTVVKPGEGKREKMEQVIIEASKQSGRNRLMTISEPLPWPAFLEQHLAPRENSPAFLAHPGGKPLPAVFPTSFPEKVLLIVGPEGGFTDPEVADAEALGAVIVGLGENILRIETAAVTLSAYAALCRSADN